MRLKYTVILVLSMVSCAQLIYAQDSITITEVLVAGEEDNRYATATITARNTIKSGASATYVAGKKIRFTKGFRVEKSSSFRAYTELNDKDPIGLENERTAASVKKPLMVYPNPATNWMNIRFDFEEGKDYQVALYDQAGKLMLEKVVDTQDNEVDITSLRAGLYLLILHGDGRSVGQFKILVEN